MPPPHILLLLYQSIIQPILLYRISHTASKVIGLPTAKLTELNTSSLHAQPQSTPHPIILRTQIQNPMVQRGPHWEGRLTQAAILALNKDTVKWVRLTLCEVLCTVSDFIFEIVIDVCVAHLKGKCV